MLTTTLVELIDPHFWTESNLFPAYVFLSITSILRAVMLFKFVRHHTGLRVLFLAVKASMNELILLLMIIAIGTIVFATLIYYAEFNAEKNTFSSIPIGFWWSIVTMTTVGYGDTVPTSALGYIVGSGCAICGMLATGLPIPVIANNFNKLYSYARLRMRSNQHSTDEGTPKLTPLILRKTIKIKPESKDSSQDVDAIELNSISKIVDYNDSTCSTHKAKK